MSTGPPPTRLPRPRRLLDAALAAAATGLHVFPVRPRAKTPAVHDWEHVATIDPDTITAYWQVRPYNIGIATGPSGLLVIDLDAARGTAPPPHCAGVRGGADVLHALASQAGQPFPGDTLTVATPSGGTHLYFRAPASVALRNTAGRLGWKIDTRGHGGYVVGAGSSGPQGRYRLIGDNAITPLPAWLVDQLTPPATPQLDGARYPLNVGTYLRAIMAAEAATVAAAQPGTRHTTLLGAACTLGRLVGGGELTVDAARATLHNAAARQTGANGMTHREISKTVDDGLHYGQRRPRHLRVNGQ